MAVPALCPACLQYQDHSRHDRGWNLSGNKGAWCPCEGDCAAEIAKVLQNLDPAPIARRAR